MHLIKKTRILILFLLINYLSLSAAGNEINPFIKNYSPRHYKGHPQVWDFAQSKNGVMYFANSIMGVLEYNGTIWRRIILPGSGISRSMDTGKDGKVYIGATGELGYLETHQGNTRYISLVHKLPEKERIFQEVWQTIATPEGIYFRTRRAIFLYRNGRMDILRLHNDTDNYFEKVQSFLVYYEEYQQSKVIMNDEELMIIYFILSGRY